MNSKEMIDWVGVKCDDIDKTRFSDPIRYIALNEAVKKIIDNTENYYLRELFVLLQDQELDANGAIDVSTFAVLPYSLTTGIIKVVSLKDEPEPLDLISYEEFIKLVKRGTIRYNDPSEYQYGLNKYYFIGSKMYCNPGDYNVDIAYLKKPELISKTQDCVLDDIFHVDVAELACAILMSDRKRQAEILADIRYNYANRSRNTDSNTNDCGPVYGEFKIPSIVMRIDE